jgi:hypothetical protein
VSTASRTCRAVSAAEGGGPVAPGRHPAENAPIARASNMQKPTDGK